MTVDPLRVAARGAAVEDGEWTDACERVVLDYEPNPVVASCGNCGFLLRRESAVCRCDRGDCPFDQIVGFR